jgi:hypothetical protein
VYGEAFRESWAFRQQNRPESKPCRNSLHFCGCHEKGHATVIGCPKLDDTDYTEKLTEILKAHEIKSVTVLRMEVPCCGGIVNAVKQALVNSNKMIPWSIVTISTGGSIVEN